MRGKATKYISGKINVNGHILPLKEWQTRFLKIKTK